MKSMYPSFAAPVVRMLGDREEAYSQRSVTERATTQTGYRGAKPKGNGVFVTSLRRCVGYRGAQLCSLLAPRSVTKTFVAPGAATSLEAP
jgi:hypothetical protein